MNRRFITDYSVITEHFLQYGFLEIDLNVSINTATKAHSTCTLISKVVSGFHSLYGDHLDHGPKR